MDKYSSACIEQYIAYYNFNANQVIIFKVY